MIHTMQNNAPTQEIIPRGRVNCVSKQPRKLLPCKQTAARMASEMDLSPAQPLMPGHSASIHSGVSRRSTGNASAHSSGGSSGISPGSAPMPRIGMCVRAATSLITA